MTQRNFERYQVSKLLTARAGLFRSQNRFAVYGYDSFVEDLRGAHELMRKLNIPHEYDNAAVRIHVWNSGWLPDAVAFLLLGTPEQK